MVGLQEELGELCEGTDVLDSIGDIMIYLFDFINKAGIDYTEKPQPVMVAKLPSTDNILIALQISLGEISHAWLKTQQGIRGTQNYNQPIHSFIYKLNLLLASIGSISTAYDVMQIVWNEVKKRDWIKYPTNGLTK